MAYYHNMLGCDMVCLSEITTMDVGAKEVVGMVVWYQPQFWSIESTRFHGPNVASWEVASSGKRTHLLTHTSPTLFWSACKTWRSP